MTVIAIGLLPDVKRRIAAARGGSVVTQSITGPRSPHAVSNDTKQLGRWMKFIPSAAASRLSSEVVCAGASHLDSPGANHSFGNFELFHDTVGVIHVLQCTQNDGRVHGRSACYVVRVEVAPGQ